MEISATARAAVEITSRSVRRRCSINFTRLAPGDLPSIKLLIELAEQTVTRRSLRRIAVASGSGSDKAERLGILRRIDDACDQRLLRQDETQFDEDSIEMMVWVCRSLLTELPSDRDAQAAGGCASSSSEARTELLEVLESYLRSLRRRRAKRRCIVRLQIARKTVGI